MENSFEAKANIILSSLGEFLGIPDLQFEEEDNTCTLQFNEALIIYLTFDEEKQELILHSLVDQLPEEDCAKMVEQLLEANLFWAGTRRATISLERESRQVILAKAIGACNAEGTLLSGESLAKAMVDLAEVNLHWKSFLKNGSEPPAREPEPVPLQATASPSNMA